MMRLHSLLLYLYPASFRSEYGAQLAYAFNQRRQQATHPFEILFLWIREFLDVVINAAHAHWDILRQDLRYTARMLAHAPGFALTAIVITGLGIGANTAAFSITDHVLLRPLTFKDSDRLVQLWQKTPAYPQIELSPPNFVDWRRSSTSFEAMAAYSADSATFLGQGGPQRLEGTRVTPEFFQILGVTPLLGRVFTNEDVRGESTGAVILTFAFWQSAFGGSADILGKTIRLDNNVTTIVGVMPRDFFFPIRGTQFWRPLVVDDPRNYARDNYYLYGIAKMKRGTTIDKAGAELNVIADQLAREYPKENDRLGAGIVPLHDLLPAQTRVLLWALFGASFCVLLIACTNLASLLIARAMARRKELTVRAAIGAGRERLVRQLLTESTVLSIAGGLLGVAVAIGGLPLLSQLIPSRLPLTDVTVLDRRVFMFAALITLATGLGFGVLPALRMCTGLDHAGLREGSRSGVGGRREWMRSGLVIAEITVSVVLLVSAGLLVRALLRVQSIDPGFRPDAVLSMQTWLPMPRYNLTATRNAFYTEVLTNVRSVPGVGNAGFISFLPMAGGGGIWPVAVGGNTDTRQTAALRLVSSGYFDTTGTPVKAGREITESDTLDTLPVAVISESFARRYWPNQNPVGRTFHFDLDFPFAQLERTVVGVVGDVKFRGLERRSEPQVYLAYKQLPDNTSTYYSPKELVIRSTADPVTLVPSIRGIINKADPEMPISAVRTLRDVVDLQTAPRSTQLRLVGAFAGLSLLLAGIGIHCLVSFAVG